MSNNLLSSRQLDKKSDIIKKIKMHMAISYCDAILKQPYGTHIAHNSVTNRAYENRP